MHLDFTRSIRVLRKPVTQFAHEESKTVNVVAGKRNDFFVGLHNHGALELLSLKATAYVRCGRSSNWRRSLRGFFRLLSIVQLRNCVWQVRGVAPYTGDLLFKYLSYLARKTRKTSKIVKKLPSDQPMKPSPQRKKRTLRPFMVWRISCFFEKIGTNIRLSTRR